MIKIENYEVLGWRHAIRGMRNPMNSWDKSDSKFFPSYCDLGPNDLKLAKDLVKAGTDHSKFMRMIVVYADITAPLYWWKEYDTYKVGTVANSCSTMHKIHAKEFEPSDFSTDHLTKSSFGILNTVIAALNLARTQFLDSANKSIKKQHWWQMIQLLPSSYNQKRTVMLSYQVLRNMYHARKNHKMGEGHWDIVCKWIESLPYSELITGEY